MLDSLVLTRSDTEGIPHTERIMDDLRQYYKNMAPSKTVNDYIGKWHETEKIYKPAPIWYYNENF